MRGRDEEDGGGRNMKATGCVDFRSVELWGEARHNGGFSQIRVGPWQLGGVVDSPLPFSPRYGGRVFCPPNNSAPPTFAGGVRNDAFRLATGRRRPPAKLINFWCLAAALGPALRMTLRGPYAHTEYGLLRTARETRPMSRRPRYGPGQPLPLL